MWIIVNNYNFFSTEEHYQYTRFWNHKIIYTMHWINFCWNYLCIQVWFGPHSNFYGGPKEGWLHPARVKPQLSQQNEHINNYAFKADNTLFVSCLNVTNFATQFCWNFGTLEYITYILHPNSSKLIRTIPVQRKTIRLFASSFLIRAKIARYKHTRCYCYSISIHTWQGFIY